MTIVVWLVVGLVAGFLAGNVVNNRREGVVLDVVLGLVGAMVVGLIIHLAGFRRNGPSRALSGLRRRRPGHPRWSIAAIRRSGACPAVR
jgi:uncharacterized membrane protein YeaQ/YmgE (transglycosylase-associated protein family)